MSENALGASPKLLIVDDNVAFVHAVAQLGKDAGYAVSVAGTLAQARARALERAYDLVLIDLWLPDGAGLDLFGCELFADARCVLITATTDVREQLRASHRYIADVLIKPVRPAAIGELLATTKARAFFRQASKVENFHGFVMASLASRETVARARAAARGHGQLCLLGEAGTGKSALARALHAEFGRGGTFVAIDCEAWGERETDASNTPASWWEQAAKGTLVLDHVGALPRHLQAQLMQHRQEHAPHAKSPLVVALSSMSIEELRTRLRPDLLYWLTSNALLFPPLRQRHDDVLAIATVHLDALGEAAAQPKRLTNAAVEELRGYSWPGNAWELKTTLDRAFLRDDDRLDVPLLDAPTRDAVETPTSFTVHLGMSIADIQQRLLDKALAHFGEDKVKVAEAMGVSVKTVYNWLAKAEKPDATAHEGTH